jgi:hypothetical protein
MNPFIPVIVHATLTWFALYFIGPVNGVPTAAFNIILALYWIATVK